MVLESGCDSLRGGSGEGRSSHSGAGRSVVMEEVEEAKRPAVMDDDFLHCTASLILMLLFALNGFLILNFVLHGFILPFCTTRLQALVLLKQGGIQPTMLPLVFVVM